MADETTTATAGLPQGAEIDAEGQWSQVLNRAQGGGLRPALFLDRDGVVVEEVRYLHKPEDVRLIDGAAAVIAHANRRAIPVVLVTNQAGIGRGYYDWPDFVAVQEIILDRLAAEGAFVNGVFACPHHGDGQPPYDQADHPWRKPNPGMLLAAAERFPVDLARSWIVGDRVGDLEAGRNARLAGGIHVRTGHGAEAGEREAALALADAAFRALAAETIGEARTLLPLFEGGG
ncbi:MAG: D-glycero-alpha-D-manno-heptose-1,7-bisphosphate 7-phosphatase [Rhodospirillales bacterium]